MALYQKGQSGNPGGRPKAMWEIAKLVHAKTKNGAELVERIYTIAFGQDEELKDAKSIRWALDWLSNRGFGKPQQVVEIPSDDELPKIDWSALSEEALRALEKVDQACRPAPAKVLKLVPPGDGGDGSGAA